MMTNDPKFGDLPAWAQKEIVFAYQRWYVAHQDAMAIMGDEFKYYGKSKPEGERYAVAVVCANRIYLRLLERFCPPGWGLVGADEPIPPPKKSE